jgi:plastocyanin
MRCICAVLTLFFLLSLFINSPAAIQNPAGTTQKPLYRPNGNEATLVGSIFVDGKVPESPKLDMSADPVCVEINRPQARTDDLLTSNQGLQNAFVYVKDGAALNDYSFAVPASDVSLERRNCRFSPHVAGLRVGQRLSVVNHDPTQHNTHPTPRLNVEWNMTQAVGGEPYIHTFTRPEQFIPVKCNHHPWERAILGVFAHPFFAVSDQLGNYEIRGLPEGSYKLVVWHERLGEKEMEITVARGENRRTDFTFSAPASRF